MVLVVHLVLLELFRRKQQFISILLISVLFRSWPLFFINPSPMYKPKMISLLINVFYSFILSTYIVFTLFSFSFMCKAMYPFEKNLFSKFKLYITNMKLYSLYYYLRVCICLNRIFFCSKIPTHFYI